MLVKGILQGTDEWYGEFTYLYWAHKDTVAFKLTQNMNKVRYLFTWELADMIKLASGKSKDVIEVVDLLQGVTLRWDGIADEFQVVRAEDEWAFSFGYLLTSVKEWLRLAKTTMIERDVLNGQVFESILIPKDTKIDCYSPDEYRTERRAGRCIVKT